jgi:hypothetical protein
MLRLPPLEQEISTLSTADGVKVLGISRERDLKNSNIPRSTNVHVGHPLSFDSFSIAMGAERDFENK